MKKEFLAIIFILLISISVSLPLLKSGLYVMHDDQQIARLYLFDKALKAGQFPVRWVDELGFGFGYPLFNFYPPFVYALGEIFHLFGFGYINSIKLVFFFGIFLSGIGMYIFTRELWGRFSAVVAAVFYLLLPYRAIDVYIRGALAESFSFVWPPLILWSFYKLFKTEKFIHVISSAVFLTMLMLTHNLIFLAFMLILPFYLLFLLWKSEKKIFYLKSIFLGGLLAACLSAFFWLPALMEKQFTLVDDMLLLGLADYKIHFVFPHQLWNWSWGFGGSSEGLADGISFKIGKLHVLVSFAAIILGLIIFTKKSSRKSIVNFKVLVTIMMFWLFFFSAFLTTFYSKFIWDNFRPLTYLQFPWRFLLFTGFFSSILAGSLIFFLRLSIFRLVIGIILIAFLFIINSKLFKPQRYRLDITDDIATSTDIINWDVSRTSFEYIPKDVELIKDVYGLNMLNISESDLPKDKIMVVEGKADIKVINRKPQELVIQVDAQEDTKLQANIFNFPGWQALTDGVPAVIDDKNKLKLIQFYLDEGEHSVLLNFQNTKIRSTANYISLAAVLLLLILSLRKWQIHN